MRDEQASFYNSSDMYFSQLKDSSKSEYLSFLIHYLKPGSKILDIGCGTGNSTAELAARGFEAIGADGCERFVEHARTNFAQVRFILADASGLPFDDNAFDSVASYNALEHFDQIEPPLREMIRVVSPGGLIAINCPNLLSPMIAVAALKNGGKTFEGKKNLASVAYVFFRNCYWLMKKKISNGYFFMMRQPSFDYDFPDKDATYFANPIDLKKFFLKHNCQIVVYQRFDHIIDEKSLCTRFLAFCFPSFMGITRVVVKKNE